MIIHSIFFLIGGLLYQVVEILWRGYTHPSMFIVGGLCFVLLGLLNEVGPCKNMPLLFHMICAAGIVTAVELLAGLVVNIWLGLDVWDYSNLPGNFLGQVCIWFSLAWFVLSLPAMKLEDWLHTVFDPPKQQKPASAPTQERRHAARKAASTPADAVHERKAVF